MSARGSVFAVAASLVVVATLVAAIAQMRSPSAQRDIRLDERRVDDLNAIEGAIDLVGAQGGALPEALAELAEAPGATLSVVDPVHGTPYRYVVKGTRDYRLCARFATDSAERGRREAYMGVAWQHPAGEHCFTLRMSVPRESAGRASASVRDAATAADEAARAADEAADAMDK